MDWLVLGSKQLWNALMNVRVVCIKRKHLYHQQQKAAIWSRAHNSLRSKVKNEDQNTYISSL